MDRKVSEVIREIDTKEAELDYIILQYEQTWEYIHIKVRNCYSVGLSVGRLKYLVGFNYHQVKSKMINGGRTEDKCSSCQHPED